MNQKTRFSQWLGGMAFTAVLAAFSASSAFAAKPGAQLELGLTGPQLEAIHLARKAQRQGIVQLADSDEQRLAPVLAAGKRLLSWVDFINQRRPADRRISLSSAETQPAYPLESPKIYNVEIVRKGFDEYAAQAPLPLRQVILQGGALTETLGVSDADFVTWGLTLNGLYETGARWLAYAARMDSLEARQQLDVRGFYFLGKEANLDAKLKGWATLPAADRERLSRWLIADCVNSLGNGAACPSQLALAEKSGQVADFYAKYLPAAASNYDSFFVLEAKRADVEWTAAQPDLFRVPFIDPLKDTLRAYLADNIQDEWRWTGGWNLKLAFVPERPNTAHLEFEAGAVPHVNDVAGNVITMDANAPLSEYNVRWAIRHEYGHVLGFPDCYLEYYDRETATIQSYQLDTSNLMCSRRGHFNQRMFDELKKAYF
jgi:hypothetical protein